MATALDLITRSMRLAGAIGKREIPDDDEAQDGLTALNAMLDNWQIQRLYVYAIREETFTWAVDEQTRTIGAAGNFVTDLPTRIDDSCSFTVGGIDYRIKLIDVDAWSAIPDKTTTNSIPWWIYPEYGAALVTLYAYPIPNASITFNLRTWRRLQSFTALTTELALPPGNERAIVFSLSEEIAPEYGLQVPAKVANIALAARKALKNANNVTPVLATETGFISRRYTDYVRGDLT